MAGVALERPTGNRAAARSASPAGGFFGGKPTALDASMVEA